MAVVATWIEIQLVHCTLFFILPLSFILVVTFIFRVNVLHHTHTIVIANWCYTWYCLPPHYNLFNQFWFHLPSFFQCWTVNMCRLYYYWTVEPTFDQERSVNSAKERHDCNHYTLYYLLVYGTMNEWNEKKNQKRIKGNKREGEKFL